MKTAWSLAVVVMKGTNVSGKMSFGQIATRLANMVPMRGMLIRFAGIVVKLLRNLCARIRTKIAWKRDVATEKATLASKRMTSGQNAPFSVSPVKAASTIQRNTGSHGIATSLKCLATNQRPLLSCWHVANPLHVKTLLMWSSAPWTSVVIMQLRFQTQLLHQQRMAQRPPHSRGHIEQHLHFRWQVHG